MNERIKELARQCGAYQKDDDGQETKIAILIGNEVEKFAEMIVRECARVYWNIDNGETHTEYVEALKQHFGVEE